MNLNIPVIVGTSRQGRQSIKAANFVLSQLEKREKIITLLVDPLDFDMPFDGNDEDVQDPKYKKITADADGFVIVSPEYNSSFPGTLKRLIDSELKNYNHKPVAFGGVSAGPWGGVRAVESLVTVARELGLVATHTDMNFPLIQNAFDEDGNPTNEMMYGWVDKALDELVWMATVLKWGRENM